ncbi:MAG: S8 family peptidase, partial [Phycisphaerales bacterium]
SVSATGAGIGVAILDTGIDGSHPDLDGNYAGGWDFVNDDADPSDDHYHGTHCAGIVAAEKDGTGVVGVAPEADLCALKVLSSSGSGYTSDIIAAIQWCVNNDVDVISMSLGSDYSNTAFEDACQAAYNAGIVLVAAAGNDYSRRGRSELDTVDYPGAYGSVIAVAATDSSKTKASFSSAGPDVELAAPGVSIKSTIPGDYGVLSGTSMACPHVAGVVALVLEANPGMSNGAVRQLLRDTADDLGDSGFD